jgi:hypothetical protein
MRTVLERDDDPRVLLTRENIFTEFAEIIVSGKKFGERSRLCQMRRHR